MVVLPSCHKCLDEETGYKQDNEDGDDDPGVPARLQVGTVLRKQEQIVDHGAELQVVVEAPDQDEGPEEGRAEHEEPFLDHECEYSHRNRHHDRDDDRDVDVLAEKRDVYGRQDEPCYQESDAASRQEYADVVDADGEETNYDAYQGCRRQGHVWDPMFLPRVGEAGNEEVGDSKPNQEANEEQDYFDEPIT